MIVNPNTTPIKAQNNVTATPKTTGMVANNGVKQNTPVVAKPTATVVKQPVLIPKTTPASTPQTRITAGAKLPHASQTASTAVKQGTANETSTKVAASKAAVSPQTNSFAETLRQNGAQMNNAMPHQGKADRNGVKFVGIETMPKTNDNATTRGYALITQVPAKSYGVDVSNYQGTDLSSYARQGAKFAIVKLTEGTGYINPNAAGQIASAKANDMLAMGYVFAHSGGNTAEAKQEAEYGLAEAQRAGLPKGSYIAYDYETGASGSVPANTAAIETFMQTILHGGYLPLLYSGNAYLHAHVNINQVTNDYKGSLWVASYPTMGATSTPNWNYFPSNPGVAMWQFTDDWKGMKVDGDVATLPLSMEGTQTTAKPAPAVKPSTSQPQSKPAANNNSKPMIQPTTNKPSTINPSNFDPKANHRHLPIKNSKPSNTSADDTTTTQTAGTSKQAPTTTKLPDININVAANAKAKANAKANADANVNVNSEAVGKGQAKACGLGSVMPAQMTCGDSCGSSAVEGQITPVAVASLGAVETVGGYQATSPVTTTVALSQVVPAATVQGQGSVAMPATGQKNNSVLADLAAVAVTMLGGSMLLKKRNA